MLKLAAIRQLSSTQPLLRGSAVLPWWPLALTVLGVLAILALAETVWLPKSLPREYVARTSLLVFPAAESSDAGGWSEAVPLIAREMKLAENRVAGPRRDNEPSTDDTSQVSLLQAVRVSTQCVQILDSGGRAVEGLLVSATVRGDDDAGLGVTAESWAKSFGVGVSASYPFLTVQSTEASQVRYGPCTGR